MLVLLVRAVQYGRLPGKLVLPVLVTCTWYASNGMLPVDSGRCGGCTCNNGASVVFLSTVRYSGDACTKSNKRIE